MLLEKTIDETADWIVNFLFIIPGIVGLFAFLCDSLRKKYSNAHLK